MQGQAVCSYYSLYGLCKYGPTCKFDHPLDGYSYAYSLSVPPMATAYSPPSPYQRTASLVPISETSLAKSSKLNDWIKKGATASNKNQHSNTKSLGDSPDGSDSLPHSSKASSEVIHNESDWRVLWNAWNQHWYRHHHITSLVMVYFWLSFSQILSTF